MTSPWLPHEALLAQVEELHMFDVHRGVLDEEHLKTPAPKKRLEFPWGKKGGRNPALVGNYW
jgi:hypothetical protein